MEYPIFRQNHVNSGFSWGKLVVMIWTMKRWDTTQEVCNGDTKQQTMGMWTDNHGTWNNINMNKSMWWFRAITSLGVNKWIMKCQKHETNFPFGFFSWTLQAPIICLVWSLDSDGHYFPRHEMPGIEVVTRTAWGGDGRGWLCSSMGVFLGVPSQVVPSSKPIEVFQKNADFESEVVALLGRRGWPPLQRCRFQQKALILEWVSPKLRNSEVFPTRIRSISQQLEGFLDISWHCWTHHVKLVSKMPRFEVCSLPFNLNLWALL